MKPSKKIDLGLSVLSCLVPYGQPMSRRDISEVCDCSEQYLHMVERSAIEKLRKMINKPDFLN